MMRRCLWVVLVAVFLFIAAPSRAQIVGGTCVLLAGSGSPESAVVGDVCYTYFRTDTGDIYTKQSGSDAHRVDDPAAAGGGQRVLGSAGNPERGCAVLFWETDQATDLGRWRIAFEGQNDADPVSERCVHRRRERVAVDACRGHHDPSRADGRHGDCRHHQQRWEDSGADHDVPRVTGLRCGA